MKRLRDSKLPVSEIWGIRPHQCGTGYCAPSGRYRAARRIFEIVERGLSIEALNEESHDSRGTRCTGTEVGTHNSHFTGRSPVVLLCSPATIIELLWR